MPQLNYNEGVAEVTPQATVPNDYQSSSAATPAAFGGQVAEGAQRLGQGALKAAEFYGQAAADDANNQYQDFSNKLLYGDPNKTVTGPDGKPMPDTGYFGMKGADALHARKDVEQQLDDKIREIRGNLRSPEQQLQFDNFSRRFRAMTAEKIGSYADQQTNVYATSTNTATAKLALDHISNNFENPKEISAGFQDLTTAYVKQAQLAGAKPGDPQFQEALNAAKRDGLQAQLNAMAVKDPSRALAILNKPENRAIAGIKYDDMANSFRARADQQSGYADADRRIAQRRAQSVSLSDQLAAQGRGEYRFGVVNGTIPAEGRALLDRIAMGESAGRYNIRYGGGVDKAFDNYADHPRIAEPITSGPDVGKTSTAAGRYQFIAPTWDAEAKKLGLKDFSPANQDAAAWDLAQTEYKARTGKDLLTVLRSGDKAAIDAVPRALSGQWSSLPGGRQPAGGGSLATRGSPAESLAHEEGELKLQVLNDPDMANRPLMQSAALNRINVYYAAQREAQASDAAAFKLKLANTTAEALDTGSVQNPLAPDEFTRVFGPDEGAREYREYQSNIQLGADVRAVASMSPDQIATMQERYRPKPGSDDYAEQEKRAEELQRAVEQNCKELKDDPAAFLIQRTAVGGEAWKRFSQIVQDPQKSPEEKKVAASMFTEKVLAEQGRLGVPEAERRLVPKSYIKSIGDQLTGAASSEDPGARAGVIGMVKQQAALWGDHWGDVMRELAPSMQPVVRAIAAGADESAMQRLLSVDPKEKPSAVLREQNAVKANEVTTAVNTEMAPFLSTMVGRQRDRDYSGYLSLANELAALEVRDGKDATTAAHDAFNALIGNRYEFRDTYRIPKDPALNADDIQHGAEALRGQLGPLGAVPPLDDIPGRSDSAPADDLTKLGRDAVWVTSPRNDGLNLVYRDAWVRGGDGRPLFVPWADLAKAGRAAQAQAASGATVVPGP
jgi:muramidase (phage lysozyme)